MSDETSIVELFVALADSGRDDYDVIDAMGRLVEAACRFTPAVDAGLLLADDEGVLHIVASTSERSSEVEEAQLGAQDGPCFEAYSTRATVTVDDLDHLEEHEQKWTEFARACHDSGFQSVLALPLSIGERSVGSLNVFFADDAPGSADVALLQVLAAVATVGMLQQRLIRTQHEMTKQLQGALDSRILIEQAKGALAGRNGITVDQAFALIRAYARANGKRLHDVAREVAHEQLAL